ATQMLDSMQQNPRPTRAEVADVANAIYDGTDAVMLSGESAAGKYPVEAVKMQASIAIETEKHMAVHAELAMPEGASGTRVVNNVVGMSAVQMATAVGAKCITVPTTTGRTARLISHFRPNMPILAFSRHEWAVQQMIMYWGVIPRQAEITQGTVNGTIVKAVETAKELGFVEKGDLTVATAGDARLSVELEGKVSSTNLAYVAQVR
ncbi:MAG: pyruvate kinase, partial [Collinsella intestinalis]